MKKEKLIDIMLAKMAVSIGRIVGNHEKYINKNLYPLLSDVYRAGARDAIETLKEA